MASDHVEPPRFHVTIVIPVFNEERLLATAVNDLVARLQREMPVTWEVILSENGSRDRTLEIARELAERHRNLRVIHTPEPNYGRALRRGIEEARGFHVFCDEIDICDVDFYQRALEILMADQADMVVGSKRHPEARDRRPFVRRLATRVLNLLLRVIVGFHGTDTHGLKAFRRDRLMPVVQRCIVEKDLFASELVIRAEREVRVREIPVTIVEKRPPSINLFRRVPNVLRNLWRLFVVIRLGRPA
ncbi:MAG TPA: glycosyltransferase [Myxococcota bacterium]|nr:glycosyltransferase [Myxococcota bacterium]HQK52413.1 glycosyltransferase [Myxococcota bacterium]